MPRARTYRCTVGPDGDLPEAMLAVESWAEGPTRGQLGDQLKLYAGREVEIKLQRPKRSKEANAYLWAVAYHTIRNELTESGEAIRATSLHAYYKDLYLEPWVEIVRGREIVNSPSSSRLDSTAFYEFVESIRFDETIVRPRGIWIPPPDKHWKFNAGYLDDLEPYSEP